MATAAAHPPYALDVAAFPFPSLAGAAARAAIGGEREAALACFMLARLSESLLVTPPIPPTVRNARAAAARAWLTSLALAPAQRAAFLALADACAGDVHGAARALDEVIAITATTMDPPAHSELLRLAERLRG